jgi:hypothetical protein
MVLALPGASSGVRGLKTFSASGKQVVLEAGKETELLRHAGKGCLTHMWFGGSWKGYEYTRIRVYVDGEQQASIDMELGLGHGEGFDGHPSPWGIARFGRTGQPSGIYNTYRIPFGSRVRVTAELTATTTFWWIVRGTENLPVEIGGVRLPAKARLRLYKRERIRVKPLDQFVLVETKGSGLLYQVAMAARGLRNTGHWKDLSYMEAQVRAWLDGAREPVMLSSGLEDYFLGTYYFNRGRYTNEVAGLTHIDKKTNAFSAYRLHEDDPVFYQRGLKLTCRNGEELNGKVLHDPPETEFTTYTWLYQW